MSTKCTIIIRREENWYVATDIHSGVASQGKTIDEATANLKEALSLYYEDNKLQGEFDVINLIRDNDAAVWVAQSDDVPGLVLESGSFDALIERLRLTIPEMIELNTPQ